MTKRKRREHIPHEVINGIEHKYCYTCDQWKILNQFGKNGNGKRPYCKACTNNSQKQRNKPRRKKILQKRKKARQTAPAGFSVCLFHSCTVKGLQPLDQFVNSYVHTHGLTRRCLTCRDKDITRNKRRYTLCQKVWDDWRREHPCVICSQDLNHEHNYLLIEADHLPEFKKIKQCSLVGFWSRSDRGPPALKAELKKCQSLCRFHHQLVTQERNHDNGKIAKQASVLRRRAIINAEKHKRRCCLRCKRVVKKGEESGFDFDHRDPLTKFVHKNKFYGPSKFVDLYHKPYSLHSGR